MKTCTQCKRTKDESYFPVNPERKCGYTAICKACYVKRVGEYRAGMPLDERRRYRLNEHYKRTYGITIEQGDEILASQGNKCRACETADPGSRSGRFDLDHDHKTGEIRGYLCHPCNSALGQIKDDPKRLQALIHYLEYNLSTSARQAKTPENIV